MTFGYEVSREGAKRMKTNSCCIHRALAPSRENIMCRRGGWDAYKLCNNQNFIYEHWTSIPAFAPMAPVEGAIDVPSF